MCPPRFRAAQGAPDPGAAQVAPAAAPALQTTDIKVGTGFTPKPGQTCVVHYTGWLYENRVKGKKLDSSVDRKTPFAFVLGEHKVIEGWERGVSTMKIGGKRTLHHSAVAGLWIGGIGHDTPEFDADFRGRASECEGLGARIVIPAIGAHLLIPAKRSASRDREKK